MAFELNAKCELVEVLKAKNKKTVFYFFAFTSADQR